MASPAHVLIIGAGITGLLIAQGLKEQGIRFTIFEAETATAERPREWTMGVHWSMPLLANLLPAHLLQRLSKEATVDPSLDYTSPPMNGMRIYDGVSGDTIVKVDADGPLVRISRRKLRKLCLEELDVEYGHVVDTITCKEGEDQVTATFTNGSTWTGTLLIGADGPRSAVRTLLLGPEKAKIEGEDGTVGLTMLVRYDDAERATFVRSAHPVWSLMIYPDMFVFYSVQDVPDPEQPEDWRFIMFAVLKGKRDATMDNEQRLRMLKEKGAVLAEPYRSAIQWIPDETDVQFTNFASWVSEPWDTREGRVTLAGDAAHPMPPYRGQGLNHAIQDASNIVQALSRLVATQTDATTRTKSIQAYSDEVAKRGAEEVLLSRKNGQMLMGYHDFMDSPYAKQGLRRQQD